MRQIKKNSDGAIFLKNDSLKLTVLGGSTVSVWAAFTGPGSYTVEIVLPSGGRAIFTALAIADRGEISVTTSQIHAGAGGTSDVLVKTVLDHGARFNFTGSIGIAPGAQKSDAYQRNENLVLDEASVAVSKPILEISASDVRCTHGATVRPVSPEIIWYLTSRGIKAAKARALEAVGFLSSVTDRAGTPAERKLAEKFFRGIMNTLKKK